MRMTQTEFAKFLGCSRPNIYKFIKKEYLKLGEDNKLDLEDSLKRLRSFNLLDENNKLKNAKNNKTNTVENIKDKETNLLDKNLTTSYKTLADLTQDEKEQIEKERIDAFNELEAKREEARDKNIDLNFEDSKIFNYAEAKAFREYYMGQIAELDYQIKLGEYIPKVEVEQSFFEVARTVRDMLLNLPNKMAMRIVGKKDIKEIELIIDDEIRYILGNLSR
ncbi:hypothetical protein AAX26_01795 [Aliarcobacter thereius]|uniref:hypothetical protein n=1 Tax=Aliarcobacter thereius TaxID=544718 RepID=UPI00082779D1|nr:hypothetical protein [Aliarcobacter thereius]OCL85728.1 hypothetical protein AAX26_01795 [Aliarcobacter thereius]